MRHIPLAAAALLLLGACYGSHGVLEEFECPEGTPDDPEEVPPVDLLFVIDNSESMEEEQDALRDSFDDLLRALVTGDAGADGVRDFPPVTDLHVGVVTADLGVAVASGCSGGGPGDGRSGVLRRGDCGGAGFVSVDPEAPEASVAEFACLASVGVAGCAVEQPLEAALLALSADARGVLDDLRGRAELENAGFLRPGSVRIVVVVTDEDDASIGERGCGSRIGPGGPSARARAEAVAAHPIARYADAFAALGAGGSGFALEIVAGVPPALVGQAPETILAARDMQRRYDATSLVGIESSCRSERGVAYPPRRLVETAAALGTRASIHSLCEADFGAVALGIAEHVGATVRRATCER